MIGQRSAAATGPIQVGARRSTAYERPTTSAPAGSRAGGGADRRAGGVTDGGGPTAAAAVHGRHRHQMLMARMTHGAQQRSAEKAAIKSMADSGKRRAAERESKTAYDKSPENHGSRRVGRNGLKIEKPKLEQAVETTGKMVAGTAKRLQRDIRYALARPDKTAMRIGGSAGDVRAERPSAASRPAPVRAPSPPEPVHAR